ncbi:MAG: hypothetical protein ABI641_05120 [Caldimonas sp.]
MSIASYIRVTGRGKEGARALGEADAHDLLGQLLDGRVSDLEIGALALAKRIKGESTSELAGFLRAVHDAARARREPAFIDIETLCSPFARPEYATMLADFIAAGRLDAMLMRGTEGEPVANARRLRQLAVYLGGKRRDEVSASAGEGALTRLPSLPEPVAVATAAFVSSVAAARAAMPGPVASQIDAIVAACAALAERAPPG